jgi:hypothetical protein
VPRAVAMLIVPQRYSETCEDVAFGLRVVETSLLGLVLVLRLPMLPYCTEFNDYDVITGFGVGKSIFNSKEILTSIK